MPAVPIVRVRPDKAFPEYFLSLLLWLMGARAASKVCIELAYLKFEC